MPFFVRPGQFARQAEFYHQLAALTGAGVGLIPALDQLRRHPPSAAFRAPLGKLLDELNVGATFAEAVAAGGWTTEFETAVLDAGERSGRLEQCFKRLADYHDDKARLTRQLLADLAYPVFVLHCAVFILPFAQFFNTGDWQAYVAKTFGVLLPLYALVALDVFAAQGRHGVAWRAVLEGVLRPVPWLGAGRRELALARLAAALEALISAGVTIIEAWQLASHASGSPALARAVARWKQPLAAGRTPADLVAASACFPELFANQYATGEHSGKLDESLRRLHRYYQEEGSRKVEAVAQWAPRVFYLIVAGLIAWKVVGFWTGYFGQLQSVGGF
jgi:type II secretory pathway component PulF